MLVHWTMLHAGQHCSAAVRALTTLSRSAPHGGPASPAPLDPLLVELPPLPLLVELVLLVEPLLLLPLLPLDPLLLVDPLPLPLLLVDPLLLLDALLLEVAPLDPPPLVEPPLPSERPPPSVEETNALPPHPCMAKPVSAVTAQTEAKIHFPMLTSIRSGRRRGLPTGELPCKSCRAPNAMRAMEAPPRGPGPQIQGFGAARPPRHALRLSPCPCRESQRNSGKSSHAGSPSM